MFFLYNTAALKSTICPCGSQNKNNEHIITEKNYILFQCFYFNVKFILKWLMLF